MSPVNPGKKSTGPLPPIVPSERPGPVGGKRDRNRRERTRALLEAALDLFLEEGIEAVTIEAIARAGGVAKGSFYRYFRDKLQLVEALIEPVVNDTLQAFERCREALERSSMARDEVNAAYIGFGLALGGIVERHPRLARLYLLESRGAPRGAREPLVRLASLIAAGAIQMTEMAQGYDLLRDVDPRVSALASVGAIERLLAASLDGDLDLDAERVTRDLITIFQEGLRPEEG